METSLDIIYKLLYTNDLIKAKVGNRISFFIYEKYEDESKPFILLRPLNAQSPVIYGNDEIVREAQDIQIDVQAMSRNDCIVIMNEIEKILIDINCRQINGDTLDEYFEEVRRFCIAKRFRYKTKI